MDPPDLAIEKTLNLFGFPATIRTNSESVMEQFRALWGNFERRYDTEPISVEAQLVETASVECPPAPTYRFMMPLVICVADQDNYSIVDLDRCRAKICVSTAALRYPLYAQYFLLGTPGCCVTTSFTTPVHSGCVALSGRGVLLCGDSGAGKSTLAYACARSGWTYVTDDGSLLLNGGTQRIVTGDCYKVRFRGSAAELFPELKGMEITPRAAGKPSIEVSTDTLPHIARAQTTRVDFIVFLNRRTDDAPQLAPYGKDVARQFMRQTLFGSAITRAAQYAAIENLLGAEVFELKYNDLDWAIERLRRLVEKGR
jgi:hypothetical protein